LFGTAETYSRVLKFVRTWKTLKERPKLYFAAIDLTRAFDNIPQVCSCLCCVCLLFSLFMFVYFFLYVQV